MTINILIVDDHTMIRKGLRRHLEAQEDFAVVGEAVNGRDGVAKAETLRPDVVLMDIAMPEMDGIEATRRICERLPQIKVLMLSIYNSTDHIIGALASGARGYILKESAAEEVVAAIRAVMSGSRFFGAGVSNPQETEGTKA